MLDDRLPTWLWIEALIRRAQVAGASAFVRQKGDRERGDTLIKVSNLTGQARIYAPRTTMDGARVFADLEAQGVGPEEASAEDYAKRTAARDPDLWLVEIEDRDGRHFLTEPVENQS